MSWKYTTGNKVMKEKNIIQLNNNYLSYSRLIDIKYKVYIADQYFIASNKRDCPSIN